ncbi:MAG: hypothetical protein HRT35_23300 [Algicola sp.]|nr:hypothetical protein [Algicola sp.]
MPLSESQHYYLQSMGIDLYAHRDVKTSEPSEKPTAITLKPKPKPEPKVMAKPEPVEPLVFKMALSELTDSTFIGDICCLLNIKPVDIDRLGDANFNLGALQWTFNDKDQDITFTQNALKTGLLTTLTNVKAKRVLWKNLMALKPADLKNS